MHTHSGFVNTSWPHLDADSERSIFSRIILSNYSDKHLSVGLTLHFGKQGQFRGIDFDNEEMYAECSDRSHVPGPSCKCAGTLFNSLKPGVKYNSDNLRRRRSNDSESVKHPAEVEAMILIWTRAAPLQSALPNQ